RVLSAAGALFLVGGCSWFYGTRPHARVALNQEPKTLDAVEASDPASQWLIAQLQRGLTQMGPQGAAGDLSEGWSLDVSGKRYTFVLAPTKWSDGVPLRAADFVFAWRRHLLHSASPAAKPLLQIEGAAIFQKSAGQTPIGLRATAENVFEVILAKPNPAFPSQVATALLGPQREEVVQKHPLDHSSPLHLRAIGSYQPTRWDPGVRMDLAVNSYAPQAPAVPLLELVFNPEAAKTASIWVDFPTGAFRSDTAHVALLPEGQNGPLLKGLLLK
ncbi:hypothetical protein K2X33_07595, partial [bacterium]|nr:hypothetical protein [bacterium]